MNFNLIINKLQEKRGVFHSEDDLKLEMALVIKELYPGFNVRLERPIIIQMHSVDGKIIDVRAPIDIVVLDNELKKVFPIEIKYKTKRALITDNLENFDLANHGANDVGRYSFRKDIYRIENVKIESLNIENLKIEKYAIEKGFVFILTNDKAYYQNDISTKGSLDSNFSFHHGSIINANYAGWNIESLPKNKYFFDINLQNDPLLKKHWTVSKEYYYNLELKNDYLVQWTNYSEFPCIRGSKQIQEVFKYCIIEVNR
ncbi:hypothetical protein ACP6L2_05980 [Sphingobacterium lactis]|uniref:hypothetical protein n=1 Tax=Sphingobacterium lactis TaxID=797291 RepID=UPI003F806CD1